MKERLNAPMVLRTLAVVLAVLLLPPVAAGQQRNNGTDKAVAHVDQFNNFENWDVSARSNFNGTEPTGYWRFTASSVDPNIVATGDITCLHVEGGLATAGGIVTGVRGGQVFFSAVVFFMFDAGKFATTPDLFGYQLLPAGELPDCLSPTPFLQPVIDGEVIVQDALS